MDKKIVPNNVDKHKDADKHDNNNNSRRLSADWPRLADFTLNIPHGIHDNNNNLQQLPDSLLQIRLADYTMNDISQERLDDIVAAMEELGLFNNTSDE